MALKFRNLNVSPDDPVEMWGVEGILAAIDRGDLTDWRRIAGRVVKDPHGEVAQDLAEALDMAESQSSAAVLRLVLDRARETPKERVARKIREAIAYSGLSQTQFAERLGTSASRLSTYASGKVVPSAAILEQIEDIARQTR
ncbi:helix-turn-helix domain-containing protein [Phytoactinopolyspora limicola]|uniref:helix-turn-helix domain-containing protein n=1 Tax=Phytoactinopolyspora limicola TaxID=2715536 RepID=UPI00140D9164|nr:helix-turn-helix transcriptional regulator [Phytoactinopolyspora limicola]